MGVLGVSPSSLPTPHYPLSLFFSNSCALFCTFLHFRKSQPVCFHAIPHSLQKKKRHGGGRYPRRKPCDKFDPPHRLQHRKNVNPKSKKAPRLDREALLAKGLRQPLEDDLYSELHVEWFAGTNPRCALEVAGSVSHLAESAGCGALKRVSRSRAWLARTGTRGHSS